ncbi:hypothetical protein NMG60_11017255 [Bertholletia excelsa]
MGISQKLSFLLLVLVTLSANYLFSSVGRSYRWIHPGAINRPETLTYRNRTTNIFISVTVTRMASGDCGVYTNDKPFKPGSGTRPRTEVRIKGLDYSSGVWQFEGYAFVPNGSSGVTIMQIHGAREGATTLQLRIYDGDMKYYKFDVIETDLYDKWFRLNVIHDVDEGS